MIPLLDFAFRSDHHQTNRTSRGAIISRWGFSRHLWLIGIQSFEEPLLSATSRFMGIQKCTRPLEARGAAIQHQPRRDFSWLVRGIGILHPEPPVKLEQAAMARPGRQATLLKGGNARARGTRHDDVYLQKLELSNLVRLPLLPLAWRMPRHITATATA